MIAAGIAMFELVHAEGGNLPAFSAGSHIDVEVEKGVTASTHFATTLVNRTDTRSRS